MLSAFGVDHGQVSKSASSMLSGAARKAGYPVKKTPTVSVRMHRTGDRMHVIETSGRHGTWAFRPQGQVSTYYVTPEGKLTSSRPAATTKLQLTRKGRIAAGSTVGGAYGGAAVAADRRHHRSVGKAYTPGTITYHQEQANLHARKKSAADRRIGAGTAIASAGVTASVLAQRHPRDIARLITPSASELGTVGHRLRLADNAIKVARAGRRGGAGLAVAGLGVSGQALASRSHHATKQNAETRRAQLARRQRNAAVAKAFDSERQRHRRQQAYEGGTVGASALSAGTARQQLGSARRTRAAASTMAAESRASHVDVQRQLHRMGQPTASSGSLASSKQNISHTARLHRVATDQNREALKLASRAKGAARRGRTAAVTSAALGAAAYGIHRHDERGGRSYGYR